MTSESIKKKLRVLRDIQLANKTENLYTIVRNVETCNKNIFFSLT
jgi:hypothetical protein